MLVNIYFVSMQGVFFAIICVRIGIPDLYVYSLLGIPESLPNRIIQSLEILAPNIGSSMLAFEIGPYWHLQIKYRNMLHDRYG